MHLGPLAVMGEPVDGKAMHPAQIMGVYCCRQPPQVCQPLLSAGGRGAHLHLGGSAFLAQEFAAGRRQPFVGMADAGDHAVALQPAPFRGMAEIHQRPVGQVNLPLQHWVVGEVETAQDIPPTGVGVLQEGLSQCSASALGHMQQHELQAVINDHPVFSPRNSRISRSLRLWASPLHTSRS
jgi:hypothetical protein